jgi:hypothetical protein
VWRSGPTQLVAHTVVNFAAVPPYLVYYSAYRTNIHLKNAPRNAALNLVRKASLITQHYGLAVDESMDSWKSKHLTGVHELRYDENIRGSFCPSQIKGHISACQKGGRLYGFLPGSSKNRNGSVRRLYTR